MKRLFAILVMVILCSIGLAEVIEVEWWYPWGTPEYKEYVNKIVEDFNRTHPNIRVKAVFVPGLQPLFG